jgi:hypothetical protein
LGSDEEVAPRVYRESEPIQLQVDRYNPDLPALSAVYMPYPNPMDTQEELDRISERSSSVEGTEDGGELEFMEII